jgi:type VI protein secretion system component VasK
MAIFDPPIYWVYKRVNNCCKRHKVNLDPPITRWGLFALFLALAFFFSSLSITLYCTHLSRTGKSSMWIGIAFTGFFGLICLVIAGCLARIWLKDGAHDPLAKTEQSLEDIKEAIRSNTRAINRNTNEIVRELRRIRKG